MNKKMEKVLSDVLCEISPSEREIEEMRSSLKVFILNSEKRIKKLKIDAEVFVGGSFSKNTLVKKKFYDVDIFLRFGKKHEEKHFSRLSKKILNFSKKIDVVHGSREYFRIKAGKNFYFEVVPVRKVSSAKSAANITDLSYLHSKYIRKKVRTKKILDGIKFAKAFTAASRTYGAESYVHGFSGYSLELLIYHFGSFERFLKELVKPRKEKLVVDIEKFYKKGNVLLDMNGSKLESPVILVDPTYKARNVLAALSEETYEKFQSAAKKFLAHPSADFFREKKIDYEKIQKNAHKKNFEFLKLRIKTKKDKGDVAGAKLLKFFNHLKREFSKYFEIKKSDFEYENGKFGVGYFVLKSRKEIEFMGPSVKDVKNVKAFKKEHVKTFAKRGRVYAREKIRFSAVEFLKSWTKKNKRKIKEMSISGIEII